MMNELDMLDILGQSQPVRGLFQNSVLSGDSDGMSEIFSMPPPSSAGEVVTESSAMRISAVWACVRLLSGSVGILPLPEFRRASDGSRERAPNGAVWRLLNVRPNPRWSATTMLEWVTSSMLLRGDGYAWVRRRRRAAADGVGTISTGAPAEIWPLHPDCVTARLGASGLVYEIDRIPSDLRGIVPRFVPAVDMLHFAGFGFNGVRSLSTIQWGANSAIGVAQAADRQAGVWLKSGGAQQYALRTEKRLTDDQIKQLRAAWVDRYADASEQRKPLVLTDGLSADTISVSADDAQLLESRQYQVADIARAFGVPPFMLGSMDKSTAWGSGLEQMGRGYLIYALQPHLRRFEQELNDKLFGDESEGFVEFNVDGLYRADLQTRSESYQKALGGNNGPGWMTVNEVRRKENLPPMEGGDKLFSGPSGVANPFIENANGIGGMHVI